MRLTRATPEQARECREIDFGWSESHAPEGCAWWVVDGAPVNGYCAAQITPDGETVRLERAYVAPTLRGLGLQRRMIRVRLRFGRARGASKAYTYTWGGNVRSQRSLIREGFLPSRSVVDSEGTRWTVYEREI